MSCGIGVVTSRFSCEVIVNIEAFISGYKNNMVSIIPSLYKPVMYRDLVNESDSGVIGFIV